MPTWGLPALSWLISFYFLAGFVVKMGFPPTSLMSGTDGVLLFLWLFFLFLPFFKKIKIGKWLELEKDIHQTKEELKQLRESVQTNLSIMATSISTISNLSNQVTVNLPGVGAAQEAKQQLEQSVTPSKSEEVDEIKSELTLEVDDTIMALARTRILLEQSLRSILGKRTKVKSFKDRPVRLMGLLQLYKELVTLYPEFAPLEQSISYVNKVCSAAIHAQKLPPGYAEEALDMGAKLIAMLNDFPNEGNVNA